VTSAIPRERPCRRTAEQHDERAAIHGAQQERLGPE
jgi:hypothetical protein